MFRTQSRHRHAILIGAALSITLCVPAGAALAATPSVPPGFTIKTFATAPGTTPASKGADDIARLGRRIFVGFQNNVPKTGPAAGGPQNSTVAEYRADGSLVTTFPVRGRVDGMAADAANHRLIITTNEDGNSTLHTLTPSAPAGSQVVDYTYSPDPSASADTTHDNTVHTGGGTDSVSVIGDQIFLAASAPNDGTAAGGPNPHATATFQVTLSGTTATLTPTFPDDATATVGGGGSGTTTLNLSDPDSTATVPFLAPLYGGQFVLDSQADQQLIFVNGIGSGPPIAASNITQLPLKHADPAKPGGTVGAGVDDVRWTGGDGSGTLIAVDGATDTIYSITGPFASYQALASLDTLGATANTTELDTLDPSTGLLTPFGTGFGKVKGLLWIDPRRHEGERGGGHLRDHGGQGGDGQGHGGQGGDSHRGDGNAARPHTRRAG